MKQYVVTIGYQEVSTKGTSHEEVRNFNQNDLHDLYQKALERANNEDSDEIYTFDTLEEAEKKFDELLNNNYSRFFWGNDLLDIRIVRIEPQEVDEDGDVVEFYDTVKMSYCSVN